MLHDNVDDHARQQLTEPDPFRHTPARSVGARAYRRSGTAIAEEIGETHACAAASASRHHDWSTDRQDHWSRVEDSTTRRFMPRYRSTSRGP